MSQDQLGTACPNFDVSETDQIPAAPVVDKAQHTEPSAHEQSWPTPLPIFEYEPPPAFPLNTLPSQIADWVMAISKNTETPEDLAANLALATASAAVAGKVVARIGQGWWETLSIYLAVFLGSGESKSPVLREAIAPLLEQESRLISLARDSIREKNLEREILIAQLRKAKAELMNAGGNEKNLKSRVIALQEELDSTQASCLPQLIATDLTSEGLLRTLADQNERLAILTDEAEFLWTLRSSKSWDGFMKAYDGGRISINRAQSDPVQLNMPSLVIGAASQPVVLKRLLEKREFIERGGLARFIVVQPRSKVGSRTWEGTPIPTSVRAAYNSAIQRLLDISVDRDRKGKLQRHNLTFDADAEAILRRYRASVEHQLDPDDQSGFTMFLQKHAGRVARIAAHFNLTENGLAVPVRVNDVKRALELGEYIIAHARSIYSTKQADPNAQLAVRILKWITKNGLDRISKRLCNEALRPSCADDLDEPLRLLVRLHYLRPEEAEDRNGPGRRPSPTFLVNPMVRLQYRGH